MDDVREIIAEAEEELSAGQDGAQEDLNPQDAPQADVGRKTASEDETETGEEAEIIQESRIDSILPPGTKVRLTLNAVKANVFDKETTLSLMRGVRNEVEV